MPGMFGGPQLPQMDTGPLGPPIMAAPAQPKKKGGMFGSGVGIGEAIVAALNGYLAGRGNPVGMAGLQMMNQQRQAKDDREFEEAKYQNHRKDSLADYAAQQQLQQQYGAAAQPHYFEDNSGNQWAIGPDGQPKMVHKDDLPFKLVPNGMGGVVPVDLRALMAGQGAPSAPVGKLTPLDEGGPMPQASGGFPRSF